MKKNKRELSIKNNTPRAHNYIAYGIPAVFFILLIVLWHTLVRRGVIPSFIAPTPIAVARAFIDNIDLMMTNAAVTFGFAVGGLIIAVWVGIVLAIIMDTFPLVARMVYPVILIFQAVPILIFAPLIVLWFGYGMQTQLFMVILMCFFPILLTMLRGFQAVSFEQITLLKSMGATGAQILWWVKVPNAMFSMLSGLRITVVYAISASVISEWVGSLRGLGVVIITSQKSFAIERVLAVNVFIVIMSLLLYRLVVVMETVFMPWKKSEKPRG